MDEKVLGPFDKLLANAERRAADETQNAIAADTRAKEAIVWRDAIARARSEASVLYAEALREAIRAAEAPGDKDRAEKSKRKNKMTHLSDRMGKAAEIWDGQFLDATALEKLAWACKARVLLGSSGEVAARERAEQFDALPIPPGFWTQSLAEWALDVRHYFAEVHKTHTFQTLVTEWNDRWDGMASAEKHRWARSVRNAIGERDTHAAEITADYEGAETDGQLDAWARRARNYLAAEL